MSNILSNRGKHLTIEDRILIEYLLGERMPLKDIASRLGKDPTTISKEIKRNRLTKENNIRSNDLLRCESRKDCTKKNICSSHCDLLCKKCSTINCYRKCSEYSIKSCTRLSRYPFVCNGCTTSTGCSYERKYYKAKVANAKYKDLLVSAREGLNITSENMEKLDKLISPLVLQGQSLYHISSNHRNEINCCERTLYRYFDNNIFTARNIDLPRKVKYKPRKKSSASKVKSSKNRESRTYIDFQEYLKTNPDLSVVEMDTVIGLRGSGKVLLTFCFRKYSLLLAYIIDDHTQTSVNNIIDKLYNDLGNTLFKSTFPVILTDNGSEFLNPESIEYDSDGNQRTRVFYCDPMASYQKPHVEKLHEYIRYILPKGTSFDNRTQDDITLMINHINSTTRASLNGSTPFKLAQISLNSVLLDKLSLQHIPADEVHLKPALFKK